MAIKRLLQVFDKIRHLEKEYKKYSEGPLFNGYKKDKLAIQLKAMRDKETYLMGKVTKKEYEEHLECGYGMTYEEFML